MPSENKTLNIGLNMWQGNEYPKRQDFVADNVVIDKEIKDIKDTMENIEVPVKSVNSKTGAVTLTASDVGSVPTARKVNNKALSADITLDKADVGLSNVLNYGIATTAEAQAGVVNNKYVTPALVKAAIEALGMTMKTFTSNGTFTVPPGVYGIYVTACGGGGGGAGPYAKSAGGNYGSSGGGGGGADCIIHRMFKVNPGQNISITLGRGGAGGGNSVNGLAGSSTVLSGLVTLSGGGATDGPNGGKPGGSGGGKGGGADLSNAGDGLSGYGGEGKAGGGGGGSYGGGGGSGGGGSISDYLGNGGGAIMSTVYSNGGSGINGTISKGGDGGVGAGGGGAWNSGSGGKGGDGIVIIEW